jgi:hypothetical protein
MIPWSFPSMLCIGYKTNIRSHGPDGVLRKTADIFIFRQGNRRRLGHGRAPGRGRSGQTIFRLLWMLTMAGLTY